MPRVIVVGAGPAGATLAYLLAARGISVTLLERRRDFAREFRGEILMPTGVQAIESSGLGDVLRATPTVVQSDLALYMNGRQLFAEHIDPASFGGYPPLAFSQAAFLDGVVKAASAFHGFRFHAGVSVKSLQQNGERITGVVFREGDGDTTMDADLVVGADGRHSIVRRMLGVSAASMSPPMDVVWCKLPCPQDWCGVRAYAGRGHLLVAYRTWDDTLQLGWVILKGMFGELRSRGIDAWVRAMASHVSADLARHLLDCADTLDHPFLLDSVSDRVERWSQPGALLIGDAAHTMSPVGGQGVNIALRDAVVAANHLVPVLAGSVTRPERTTTLGHITTPGLTAALGSIEAERLPELAAIQAMQALPPKLMLSRAWWGEPLRRVAGRLVAMPAFRRRLAANLQVVPFGVTDVRLTV